MDSGIRRGADVAKAISFGAKAVLVGRPVLFGLAAGGEAGVHKALSLITDEFKRTMVFLGRGSPDQLNLQCVNVPRAWRLND